MKVSTTHPSATEATLVVVADTKELDTIKQHVLKQLSRNVKLPGFRQGKAPAALIEKNIDPSTLQSEFLEHAINDLYPGAVQQAAIRPVARPDIQLKKFVPFTTLEFEVTVAVVGKIQLPDYKKLKKARPAVKLTDKDVEEVITALRTREAEKQPVKRAAKEGDEVVINFKGTDEKGEAVKGAEAKDYPLQLGSKSFIPGFEDNLIGMKAGEDKTFKLTFPKDYGVKALANRKVSFAVTVATVHEVVKPKADDAFAAKVGPVQTLKQLKEDIRRELSIERQRQTDLEYESALVRDITAKSKLQVPQVLIDDQVERMFKETKQNLVYRGQTIQEFLEAMGKSEEDYKKDELAPQAEERVKASLVLAEIAEAERLEIMPEELEIRLQALKSQYKDPQMQAELDKPENRHEIAARMLSEKTVARLAEYANA